MRVLCKRSNTLTGYVSDVDRLGMFHVLECQDPLSSASGSADTTSKSTSAGGVGKKCEGEANPTCHSCLQRAAVTAASSAHAVRVRGRAAEARVGQSPPITCQTERAALSGPRIIESIIAACCQLGTTGLIISESAPSSPGSSIFQHHCQPHVSVAPSRRTTRKNNRYPRLPAFRNATVPLFMGIP